MDAEDIGNLCVEMLMYLYLSMITRYGGPNDSNICSTI